MSVFRKIRPAALIMAWAATLLVGAASSSLADDAKPKEEDSRKRFLPHEVSFTTSVTPAKVKPGGTVAYSVTATLDPTWHIYAYAKSQAPDSPVPTQFDFFDLGGLTESSTWTASKKPTKKQEPAFPAPVEYFEDAVTWTIKLKVPESAKAGKKTLRNQIHFMICDPKSCKPDAYFTLPDATITVSPDGEAMLDGDHQAAVLTSLIAIEPGPTAAKPAATIGTADEVSGRGILPFLVWCALGGLVAVLMPCVWPMIPITVNFFVKQGEVSRAKSIKLAVAYCLAIMGIFTSLGLLVTFFMGASGASDLGNNPWVNLVMGIAFIAMGLMLLGLFEIRLPNFLLNLTSQNEGRGGLIGVMFMAATLTITSFTCTAPVVGSLIGQAVKGQVFYPVLGMLTFSAVLSLPFFVLALVPSLLHSMPRSGDWMNAVKVVGGLVEIAFAFKFLNTAEISFGTTPSNAWIDANVILTAWVVAALVSGIYLLGLFKTDHDGDVVKIGPVRLMMAMLFLGIGLYLAPALFGNPPKSKFYDQIAGILPKDATKFDEFEKESAAKLESIGDRLATLQSGPAVVASRDGVKTSAPVAMGPRKATSSDPKVAIREEKRLHGVLWGMSYEDALAEAKATGKLVLVDFTGVNCANCRKVEVGIFPKPEVKEEMKKFVTVQLYTDIVDIDSITPRERRKLADDNKDREFDLTGGDTTSPNYVVVSPDGKFIAKTGYDADDGFLLRFLKEAQTKYQPTEKVAQGGAQ